MDIYAEDSRHATINFQLGEGGVISMKIRVHGLPVPGVFMDPEEGLVPNESAHRLRRFECDVGHL